MQGMVTRTVTFGEALLAARKRKGWTQAELAWQLHTSEKNVRNWEGGHHEPSLPMYERICALFGWAYSGHSPTARYASSADWDALLTPSALALTGA